MKRTELETSALRLAGYAAQLASAIKHCNLELVQQDDYLDRSIWGAECDIKDAIRRVGLLKEYKGLKDRGQIGMFDGV